MVEPSDWITRLKELGPWIVSFLALIQVWLIALWRRLRAGQLEIYESGTIESGTEITGLFEVGAGRKGRQVGIHQLRALSCTYP